MFSERSGNIPKTKGKQNMNYGLRHGTVHKLTSGSSSSASSAFSANIEYIRVVGTVACHIHVAVSPTAAATTTYLPAAEVEVIKVSAGEKIAVIKVTGSDGELYATELTE
jgi:ABC-type Fe3+-siderophore transport system permease subunit